MCVLKETHTFACFVSVKAEALVGESVCGTTKRCKLYIKQCRDDTVLVPPCCAKSLGRFNVLSACDKERKHLHTS